MREEITSNNSYPFGMLMPERSFTATTSDGYRFGFNGKLKDDDVKGKGIQYDYGFRIYDSRLGKFLSLDPLFQSYPYYTPYSFAGNMPLIAIDIDGMEEFIAIYYYVKNTNHLYKVDWQYVDPSKRFDQTPGSVYVITKQYSKNHSSNSSAIFHDGGPWNRTFFQQNQRNIKQLANSNIYKNISTSSNNGERKSGGLTLEVNFSVYFGADQGITKEEVMDKIGTELKKEFERISAVLHENPDAIVIVTGSASPIPTNIKKTQNDTNQKNNELLASDRAEAGKQSLLQYYKSTYGEDLDPSRIKTNTNVSGDPEGNSEEGNPNQKIHFETTEKATPK